MTPNDNKPSKTSSDRTAIYTLSGVIAAATIAFIGSQWSASTAFDAQMVQIGVSILAADPSKADVTPARGWAVELVEKHSGHPFSAEDRQDLLHHPLAVFASAPPGTSLAGISCSRFSRNPDGSWLVVLTSAVRERGDLVHAGKVFNPGSDEAKLLDQYCGPH